MPKVRQDRRCDGPDTAAPPVTSTGPLSGVTPWSSSAMTASIAVKPAVPTAIASRVERPSGNGTSQSALTRAFCA